MRTALFIVGLCFCCICEREKLDLLTLLPYFNVEPSLNPSGADGDNIFPALQLARDQINEHPTLLQNYSLQLIKGETGCQHIPQTMVSFVKEAYQSRRENIVGLLGPRCSSSTIALAPVTNKNEVSLVMLHGSGSPVLVNRIKYFYQLGALGSTQNFVNAIVYLVQEWEKVAILFDESRQFFFDTKLILIKREEIKDKVRYVSPVSFSFLPLDVIQELRLRVVLVLCPPELTRCLICLSWMRNMTFDNYQYVYTAHTEQDLVQNMTFTYDGDEIVCSEGDMQNALGKQFLLIYSLLNSANGTLDILGTSVADYIKKYKEYRDIYNNRSEFVGQNAEFSSWTAYFYDSMWAWALVLDNLIREDPEFFNDRNSDKFYGDENKARRILEQFYSISFEGVSGHISFDNSTGYTPRSSTLIQLESEGPIRKRGKVIATIRSSTNNDIHDKPIQIPASFSIEYIRENQQLSCFFIVIGILLLVLSALMQMMTYKYRHDAAIKATTPNLLHMSYGGIYIMLLGLLVFALYSAIPLQVLWKGPFCCVLWTWTFPIGFTLSLGPVAMQTWRLYRIFIHYMNPGRFISNRVLVGGVLALLAVDVTVASMWTGLDLIQTITQPVKLSASRNYSGFKTLQEQAFCTSKWYEWWFLFILTNKTLLLLYVIALAILTRKIKNLSFTTSSLRVLVYVTVIISALGIILWFILSTPKLNPTYSFTLLSLTIVSLVVVFIVCVFLPPLLPTLKPIATEIHHVMLWLKKNNSGGCPMS